MNGPQVSAVAGFIGSASIAISPLLPNRPTAELDMGQRPGRFSPLQNSAKQHSPPPGWVQARDEPPVQPRLWITSIALGVLSSPAFLSRLMLVRAPGAPLRGLHTSPVSRFTYGTDIWPRPALCGVPAGVMAGRRGWRVSPCGGTCGFWEAVRSSPTVWLLAEV